MNVFFKNADIIKYVDQTSKGLSLDFSDKGLNIEHKVHYRYFDK